MYQYLLLHHYFPCVKYRSLQHLLSRENNIKYLTPITTNKQILHRKFPYRQWQHQLVHHLYQSQGYPAEKSPPWQHNLLVAFEQELKQNIDTDHPKRLCQYQLLHRSFPCIKYWSLLQLLSIENKIKYLKPISRNKWTLHRKFPYLQCQHQLAHHLQ